MKKLFRTGLAVIAVAFFFNAFAVSDANAQDVLRQILNRMDEHNQGLTSLRADVTMAKYNAQLGGDPDIMKGKAIYLPQKNRDALVRIDWVSPKESLAVINKEYVLYRERLQQVIVGKVNKSDAKGTSNALAFMNMSKKQLAANYSVKYRGEATVSGGVKTWHLELTPKAAANYKSAELWVDADGMPVQAKVIENNNDSTTVLLSGIKKNVDLNTAEFKIKYPKGTKLIKS